MTCRQQIDGRTRDLQLIHIAKRDLDLDDESYRMMLREVVGVESAADLDERGRRRVIEHLKAKGFRIRRGRAGGGNLNRRRDDRAPPADGTTESSDWRQPRINKIIKLWALLRDAGVLRGDGSETALWRFCARVSGVAQIEWATSPGLNRCVEALRAWCRREGIPLHD